MIKKLQTNKDLILLISLLLCLVLLAPILRFTDLYEGLFSDRQDYRTVEGTIIESNSKYVLGGGSKTTGGYKLNIVYEYEIDGTLYRSQKFSFGQSKFHSKQDADRITSHYEPGDLVQVSVKKQDLKIAVLDLESNSNTDFILLFIITMCISLYAIRDFYLRNKKVKKRQLKKLSKSK